MTFRLKVPAGDTDLTNFDLWQMDIPKDASTNLVLHPIEERARKSLMPWNGSLPCVFMFLIKENPAGRDYYGHYSNVARGKRKKQDQDRLIPSDSEPVEDPDLSGEGSSEARPGATHIPPYYKPFIITGLLRLLSSVIGLGQGIQNELGTPHPKDI